MFSSQLAASSAKRLSNGGKPTPPSPGLSPMKTAEDVKSHIKKMEGCLRNPRERKLKGLDFARLYSDVKDYVSAKKHIDEYLSANERDYRAHNILGNIHEANDDLMGAIASFKRSLELCSSQKDILLKVITLSCKAPIDPQRAKVWADRGARLLPGNPMVFELKWHLLSKESSRNYEALEQLLADELTRRPREPSLHIKLIDSYTERGLYARAFQHCTSVEDTAAFNDSPDWLSAAANVFNNHKNLPNFEADKGKASICYGVALCKLLTLHLKSDALKISLDVLKRLDKMVHDYLSLDASGGFLSANLPSDWKDFLTEMKGQLFLNISIYLLRMAKESALDWKKASSLACACLMTCLSIESPSVTSKLYARKSPLKNRQQSSVNAYSWAVLACERLSQAGHLVLSLARQFGEDWVRGCVSEFCNQKGQESLIDTVYSCQTITSYVSETEQFTQVDSVLPLPQDLIQYDEVTISENAPDLHLIIWLGLHWDRINEPIKPGVGVLVGRLFNGIPLDVSNITNCNSSTLCLRDIEAFIYAVIRSSKNRHLSLKKSSGELEILPTAICGSLVTDVQIEWWHAAYGLYTGKIGTKTSAKLKAVLQLGLEKIRVIGDHGIDPRVLYYISNAFWEKAETLHAAKTREWDYQDHWETLEKRAMYYIKEAIRILKIFIRNKTIPIQENLLIPALINPLLLEDASALLNRIHTQLAKTAQKAGDHQLALDYYDEVKTLQANYEQVQIFLQLAYGCDVQTSGGARQSDAYLAKARDKLALCINNADNTPEYKQSLIEELEEIQTLMCRAAEQRMYSGDTKKQLDFTSSDEILITNESITLDSEATADVTHQLAIENSILQDQVQNLNQTINLMQAQMDMLSLQQHQQQLQLSMRFNNTAVPPSPVVTSQLGAPPPPLATSATAQPQQLQHPQQSLYPVAALAAMMQTPQGVTSPRPSTPIAQHPLLQSQFTPIMQQQQQQQQQMAIMQQLTQQQLLQQQLAQVPQQPAASAVPVANVLPHGERIPNHIPQQSFSNESLPEITAVKSETNTDQDWDSFMQPSFEEPSSVSFEQGFFSGLAEHVVKTRVETGDNEAPTMRTPSTSINGTPGVNQTSDEVKETSVNESNRTHRTSICVEDDIYVEPIVTLTNVVEIKTGEEDEEVRFSQRAKLYRFSVEASQWKERGVGEMKLMHCPSTGKTRVLMRRDQVLSVCCNHVITSDMNLTEKGRSTWTWMTAADGSEDEVVPGQFAIKFKSNELAEKFRDAFVESQTEIVPSPRDVVVEETAVEISSGAFSSRQPPITTAIASASTSAITTTSSPAVRQLNLPKVAEGSWSCDICLVSNPPMQTKCLACETLKPGAVEETTAVASSGFQFGAGASGGSAFSFGAPAAAGAFSFGSASNASPAFSFGANADSKPLFGTPAESKPLFVSSSDPKPLFGLPDDSKPLFGTPAESSTAKPFSFTTPDNIVEISPEGKAVFAFAPNPDNVKASSDNPFTTTKPAFSFKTETSTEESAPAFSFKLPAFNPIAEPPSSDEQSVSVIRPSPFAALNLVGNKPEAAAEEAKPSPFAGFSFQSPVKPSTATSSSSDPSTATSNTPPTSSPFSGFSFSSNPATAKPATTTAVVTSSASFPMMKSLLKSAAADTIIADTSSSPSNRTPVAATTTSPPANQIAGMASLPVFTKGRTLEGQSADQVDPSSFWSTKVPENKPFFSGDQTSLDSIAHTTETRAEVEDKMFNEKWEKGGSAPAAAVGDERESIEDLYTEEDYEAYADEYGEYGEYGSYNEYYDYGDEDYDEEDDDDDDEEDTDPAYQPSQASSSRKGSSGDIPSLEPGQIEDRFEVSRRDVLPPEECVTDDVYITFENKPNFQQKIRASRLQLPSTFYLYESKPPCTGCRGCVEDFDEQQQSTTITMETVVIETPDDLSFVALASAFTSPGATGFTSGGTSGSFSGAGAKLFTPKSGEAGDGDEVENPEIEVTPIATVTRTEKNTGEETDVVHFNNRAKLYVFSDSQWKERGIGNVKLSRDSETGWCRVVMRRDAIQKLCANHPIMPDTELTANSDKSWVWGTTNDLSDGQPEVRQFCIKFKNSEVAGDFKNVFYELRALMVTKLEEDKKKEVEVVDSGCDVTSSTQEVASTKAFVVVAEPVKEVSMGMTGEEISGNREASQTTSTATNDADANELVQDEERYIHVEAIAEVSRHVTSTGEEGEEDLFNERAKLYRYESEASEWKERGIGQMKLQKNSMTGKYRVLMRRETIQKLCANHAIVEGMVVLPFKKSRNMLMWSTQADVAEDEPTAESFLIKFKTPEQTSAFRASFEECIADVEGKPRAVVVDEVKTTDGVVASKDKVASVQADLAKRFALKPGQWNCSTCLITNEAGESKCAACETPNPHAPKVEPSTAVPAVKPFSFGAPAQSAAGTGFSFGAPAQSTASGTGFSFGVATSSSMTASPFGGFSFGASSSPFKFGVSETPSTSATGPFTFTIPNSDKKLPFGSPATTNTPSTADAPPPTENIFAADPDTWECPACMAKNNGTRTECRSCAAPRQATPVVRLDPDEHNQPIEYTEEDEEENYDEEEDDYDDEEDDDDDDGEEDDRGDVVLDEEGNQQKATGEKYSQEDFQAMMASKFGVSGDQWECGMCMVRNDGDQTSCPCCTTPRPGLEQESSKPDTSIPSFSFGAPTSQTSTAAGGFSFASGGGFNFGQPTTTTTASTTGGFSFGQPTATAPTTDGGFSFGQSTPATAGASTGGFSFASSGFSFSQKETSAPKESPATGAGFAFGQKSSGDGGLVSTPPVLDVRDTGLFGSTPVVSDVVSVVRGSPTPDPLFKQGQDKSELFNEKSALVPASSGVSTESTIATSMFGTPKIRSPSESELMPAPNFLPARFNKPSTTTKPDTTTAPSSKPPTDSSSSIFSWLPAGLNTDNLFSLGVNPSPSPSQASSVDGDAHGPIERTEKKDVAPVFAGTTFSFKLNTSDVNSDKPQTPVKAVTTPVMVAVNSPSPVKPASAKKSADNDQADEEEASVEFTPLVTLDSVVDASTGEEGEITVFSQKSKLFRFEVDSAQWKERGVGELRILRNEYTSKSRLIMRREQIHKLCANHSIITGMELKAMGTNKKAWVWSTLADISDGEVEEATFAARFKSVEFAQEFSKYFEAASQEQVDEADSIHRGETVGEEQKAANIEQDDDDVVEIVTKPASTPSVSNEDLFITYTAEVEADKRSKSKQLLLPASFYNRPSVRVPKVNETDDDEVFSRHGVAADSGVSLTSDSLQQPSSPSINRLSSRFASTSGSLSFSNPLLSNSPSGFESTSGKSFGSTNSQLFAGSTNGAECVEENGDIYVEPIVQLKASVETSSGEEGERCVFISRAKLYRFVDNTWKQRGVGDLKLLQDKTTMKGRVLMRREQVRKLCANHAITEDTVLQKFGANDQTKMWQALSDISDGDGPPSDVLVAARFKNVELVAEFSDVFARLAAGESLPVVATAADDDDDDAGAEAALIGACDPRLVRAMAAAGVDADNTATATNGAADGAARLATSPMLARTLAGAER